MSPLFSIVIPTYNRPDRLQQCLQSIAQLSYPRDRFEVIVVDDGSKSPLDPVVNTFTDCLPLRLIRQQNSGPAGARNTGAAAAQGTYLVFTDDDCQPAANWLSAIETSFADAPEALIGGHTINALPENPYSTASQLLIDYLYDYYNQAKGSATFFASNNFAMPRRLFNDIGGFDTSFPLAAGEDREFCDRWLYRGFPMRYAPDMQIYHAHSLTLARFWRQHFNYGRGAYCFHQIHGERSREDVKVEPFTFYAKLISYPLTRAPLNRSLGLSTLLLLSQAANVIGFFQQRAKSLQASAIEVG